MRKLLVLVVPLVLVLGAAAPAQADTLLSVEKRVDAGTGIDYPNGDRAVTSLSYGHELEFYWVNYEYDEELGRLQETAHLSYEGSIATGGTFHQTGIKRARLEFSTNECIWTDPSAPGADEEGCIDGVLYVRVRWVANGETTTTTGLDAEGNTVVTQTRPATLRGIATFNGQALAGSDFNVGGGLLTRHRTYAP